MKRLSFLSFALLLSATMYAQNTAVKAASATNADVKPTRLADQPNLPYKPIYATDFQIASPKYSMMVLQLWKDFENNTLENSAWMFDENVEITLADGMVIKGKAALMEGIKAYRGAMKSMKCEIHAVMSHTNDTKPGVTVGVWGSEEVVGADGKTSSTMIHEVWFFNTEGKVTSMIQFAQVPPKK